MGQVYDWNFDRVFVEASTPTPSGSGSVSGTSVQAVSGSVRMGSGNGGGGSSSGGGMDEISRGGSVSAASGLSVSDDPDVDVNTAFPMDASDLDGVMGLGDYGSMTGSAASGRDQWGHHSRQDLFGPEWKY